MTTAKSTELRSSATSLLKAVLRYLRPFWPLAAFATTMGSVSGLATAWLLATINRALHTGGGATSGLLLAFTGLCALTIAGEVISDLGNSLVGQETVAALRRDLSEKILSAPIDQIEHYRPDRLITTLNQDVETISTFTFVFSSLAIALAITLGSLIYLVILSPMMFIVAVAAIALGSTVHEKTRNIGRRSFEAARRSQDDLQRSYRAITEGAKELRINRGRRHQVHAIQLNGAIKRIRDFRVKAMRIFMSANAFGSALFFVVIGVLLALQGRMGVSNEVLSGFVLVLLYVKGPIQQVVGSFPMMSEAQVAFRRITELADQFENAEASNLLSPPDVLDQTFETVELRGATYAFPSVEGIMTFALGPINLKIRSGEMLFIVGENGSGKTTLIKMLLGLYEPGHGAVLLNGKRVTAATRDSYRQLFTTVFSDYYLFDDLVYGEDLSDATTPYLERLGIAHKVGVNNGRFTTTNLSTGQRKRLALVHAYLEQRPIMVTDEWAADQDPEFRRVFYEDLLPEMKREGKTLIVISHDDRYFHVADRLIRMADGQIIEDRALVSVSQ